MSRDIHTVQLCRDTHTFRPHTHTLRPRTHLAPSISSAGEGSKRDNDCKTIQHAATHRNTLQHPATPRNTATHCNALRTRCKHTATHSNRLQHTATHRGPKRCVCLACVGDALNFICSLCNSSYSIHTHTPIHTHIHTAFDAYHPYHPYHPKAICGHGERLRGGVEIR